MEAYNDRRYVVAWDNALNERVIVFVYDKVHGRIIYTANVKERKIAYPYIQHYYGIDNCVPPKQADIRRYS